MGRRPGSTSFGLLPRRFASRSLRRSFLLAPSLPCPLLLWFLAGCVGDTLHLGVDDGTFELKRRELVVARGGPAVPVAVSMTHARSLTAVTCSLPNGVRCDFNPPDTVTFRAAPTAEPGIYKDLVVQAHMGGRLVPSTVTLTIASIVKVQNAVDPEQGIAGKLHQYLSTSFQPADWQYKFFEKYPDEKKPERSKLQALAPQHILVQIMDGGAIPWKSQSDNGTASDFWDFRELDAIVQPLLGLTDRSPELQIAVPARGGYDFSGTTLDQFAQYCAHLVAYYNQGGFTWGNTTVAPPSTSTPRQPVTWWGILSDPNLHRLNGHEYAQIYNKAAAAMLAIDPTIRLSAVEWGDDVSTTPAEFHDWFATFLTEVTEQPIDAIALHVYGTDSSVESDRAIFDNIPIYSEHVRWVRDELAAHGRADVPVRITQNNVNADAPDGSGRSTNRYPSPFENDLRGTSQFFAAYRPYLYARLAKAGNGALYHWLYTAGACEEAAAHCTMDGGVNTDPQNSQFDYRSGTLYTSYWVDHWLQRSFPVVDGAPTEALADLLKLDIDGISSSDGTMPADDRASIEVLAAKRPDGTVVVMIVDHAVEYPEDTDQRRADNDGNGAPRTVIIDLSDFGKDLNGMGASATILDRAHGNGPTGPASTDSPIVSPNDPSHIPISLAGYGVAFVTIPPAAPTR